MLVHHIQFHKLLNKTNSISELYNAMQNDDLGEIIITVLDILRKTNSLPNVKKEEKSATKSDKSRKFGNKCLMDRNYKLTVDSYNKALACAPKNSRSMILAYSNRSYVMLKLKRFHACISDINTCFSIGCPTEIRQKLINRKQEATQFAIMESIAYNSLKGFTNDYFKCTSTCDPQLPFISKNINVKLEYLQPKITAISDINCGKIISVEEAFMTEVKPNKILSSCYYCLKITPDLIPCDTCCTALFCSEKCKTTCNQEYHSYECQIMAIIVALCNEDQNLWIKTIFKLKKNVSWKTFIKESKTLGNRRLKKSSVKEIISSKNDYAVLSFSENRPFVYGRMFNVSFAYAIMLHHISQIPSFLPDSSDDKESALRAIARVMMYLAIYGSRYSVYQNVTDLVEDTISMENGANFACYTFYGKLKTTCSPNVTVALIHNKALVIALRKIKAGEEIVTSCVDPSYSVSNEIMNLEMMAMKGTICTCLKCTKGIKNDTLSRSQAEFVENANLSRLESTLDIRTVKSTFEVICKVMDILSDVPHSKEYLSAYCIFRKCVAICEAVESENFNISS